MADELEEVRQRFTAQVNEYLDEVKRAADDTKRLGESAREARAGIDDMRDASAEAAAEAGHLRDNAEEAALAVKHLDDASSGATGHLRILSGLAGDLAKKFDGLHGSAGGLAGGIGPGILGMSAKWASILGIGGSLLGGLPGVGGILGVGGGVGMLAMLTEMISKGAYSQVSGALGSYNTAQGTTGKAQVTALKQYQAQMAALTPVQRQFALSVESMQNSWQSFVNDNTAGVSKLMSEGMGLLPKILPQLTGLFQSIVPQFKGIFASLGGVIQQFIGWMRAAAPAFGPFINAILRLVSGIMPGLIAITKAAVPMMTVFGSIMGKLGGQIGGLFTAMVPAVKAGMQVFGALMGLIGGLLPVIGRLAAIMASALAPVFVQLAGVIKSLMPFLTIIGKVIASLAQAVLGDLVSAFTAVASLLQAIAPALSAFATAISGVFTVLENTGVFAILGNALEALAPQLGQLISALLDGLIPVLPVIINLVGRFSALLSGGLASFIGAIAEGITAIVHALPPLVPTIVAVIAAVKAWKIAQAALDLVLNANPVGLLIAAIAILIGIVVEVVKHWHQMADAAKEVFGAIRTVVIDVFNWIRSHWPLLLGILSGPIGLAAAIVIGHWREISRGVARMWSDVVGVFRRLPGDIVRALGNLGSVLWSAGINLVEGFINGIVSMGSAVGNALLGLLPSPVRRFASWLGLGSPSRLFHEFGMNTLLGYVNGIKAAAPLVHQALSQVGAQIAGGGLPGVTGGSYSAGAPSVHVQVPLTLTPGTQGYNSPQFLQYLQQVVQEAVLRYNLNNPGNGLALTGRL